MPDIAPNQFTESPESEVDLPAEFGTGGPFIEDEYAALRSQNAALREDREALSAQFAQKDKRIGGLETALERLLQAHRSQVLEEKPLAVLAWEGSEPVDDLDTWPLERQLYDALVAGSAALTAAPPPAPGVADE